MQTKNTENSENGSSLPVGWGSCYIDWDPASLKGVGWVQAEAEFWRRNEGYRLGASDQLLGFDCGGQQWVLESCFPTGSLR